MAKSSIIPVLLLIFVIVIFYVLYPFDSNEEVVKENFLAVAFRAKDCRCLPGYFPSNLKDGKKIQKTYFCQKYLDTKKTMNCY